MIKEDLLQFLWQHKLLKPLPLTSISGKEIKILKVGELNRDSGPDFFNARIQVENLVLAGNIEVHVKSSDWLKHKHQENKSYDNIVLHVVYQHDKPVEQNQNFNVEVLEIKELIAEETLQRYQQIQLSNQDLPCAKQLFLCADSHFSFWLERMLIERLETKEEHIHNLYTSLEGNYTQTFFALLLKGFGFKVNAPAFELLGRQLPVQLLFRHSNQLKQCEALLLGMCGLLEETLKDDYAKELQSEFKFLKQKYQLSPLPKEIVKYSRMRPNNFPDLRLAQFAAMVHYHPEILQAPHEYLNKGDVFSALNAEVSAYWQNHYRLDLKAEQRTGTLGRTSIEILLVNSFVPFLFFYSNKQNQPQLKRQALQILQNCTFENNHKTRLFKAKKSVLQSALQSQACLHLWERYCSKKACLKCGIAASLLKIP